MRLFFHSSFLPYLLIYLTNTYILLCAKFNRTATTTKVLANTLAVQWLGLHAFPAEGQGSVPAWGTKIIQAALCSQIRKTNNLDLAFINLTSSAGFRSVNKVVNTV